MKKWFPTSFYNTRSLFGAAISLLSLSIIVFLFILELTEEQSKPYVGILTFIVLPIVLLFGLVGVFWGIVRENRRRRKGLPEGHLPVIDLNNSRHRRAFTLISFGFIFFLGLSIFGSYKAYEYTDSDRFCGELCHTVMSPEYTAYRYSPHARVGCAQCHIGSGAEWFVKAKISGSYQVYSVLFNKYSRPIQTPIDNLRPAQETCEQCHWPQHFFSEKLKKYVYYLNDEANTKWNLTLAIHIGGGNVDEGPTSGIHWHMNIDNRVTYAPLDRGRQVIPWVHVRHADGRETVYRSTEVPLSDSQLDSIETRQMDCIDCHNRPSHIYHHPANSMNHVLSIGRVDDSLPFIKNLTVEILQRPYASQEVARDSIRIGITEFYQTQYPAVYRSRRSQIDQAIDEAWKIYSRNFFPEMRVSWRSFPDNIGHMYSLGCFRCHDGKHRSDDGKVLTKDCSACHVILAQEYEKGSRRVSLEGVDYRHPVDVDDEWKIKACTECHDL